MNEENKLKVTGGCLTIITIVYNIIMFKLGLPQALMALTLDIVCYKTCWIKIYRLNKIFKK